MITPNASVFQICAPHKTLEQFGCNGWVDVNVDMAINGLSINVWLNHVWLMLYGLMIHQSAFVSQDTKKSTTSVQAYHVLQERLFLLERINVYAMMAPNSKATLV